MVALLSAIVSTSMSIVGWIAVPQVFGYESARITSGSMTPSIEPGDVVVYRADPAPRRGDVVVVRDERDALVTHRVTRLEPDGIVTKGDANARPDSTLVAIDRLVGRVQFVVPGVARWRAVAIRLLVVLGIVGIAAAMGRALVAGRRLPGRRRGHGLAAAAAGLAIVVGFASVGLAGFEATTSNAASQFSSVLDPPNAPASLDLQLESNGPINAVEFVGDTLYVGGDFTRINGVARTRLAAIDLATDSLTSWNPGADAAVLALDIDGGVAYVGGSFTSAAGVSRNRLAAIDTTTGSATSWNPNANSVVRALVVDSASVRVIVGGDFTTVSGTTRNRLASIDRATGGLHAWDANANGSVNTLAYDSTSDRIYAGGGFTTIGGAGQTYLVEILMSTGAKTTWDPNTSSVVRTLSLDAGNRLLYVGGDFTNIGAAPRNRLAAVSIDDALANAWDPSVSASVYAVVADPNRNLAYAGGAFTSLAGSYRNRFVSLSTVTGNPIRHDVNLDGLVSTLALDTVGDRIAIGGAFTASGGADRSSLSVVSRPSNPASDERLASNIDVGTNGTIHAMARVGDTLYVAGDFTYLNGARRQRLGAVDVSTGLVTSWAPQADGTVWAIGVDATTGILYVGGDFLSISGAYRQRLAAIDRGGAPTSWSPGADATVYSVATDPAGNAVYIGGTFARAGTENRTRLAKISIDTGLATSWTANVSGGSVPAVYALGYDSSNSQLYVGGAFTTIGASTRNRLARVSSAGVVDATWNPNLNGLVRTLALDSTGADVYVGGDFTAVNGATLRNRLASFPAASSIASAWNPDSNGSVYALEVDGGGAHVLVAGSFTTIGGTGRNRGASIVIASSAVTAWNPNISTASSITRALAHDSATGRVWFGGSFTTVLAATRQTLAQVSGAPAGAAAIDSLTVTAPNATGIVYATVRSGSTLFLGGTFTYVGGVARNRLASIDVATDTVNAWDPNLNNAVNALALDSAGANLLVGGVFTTVNGGTTRNRLASFPVASSTTNAWNPNPNNTVNALAVDGTTVYVGGSFTTVGGVGRNRAAAYDTTTSALTAWNPNASSTVTVILPSPVGVYLGGDFATVGGLTRTRLASVDGTTGGLHAWSPAANGLVRSLAVDSSDGTVIIGGAFSTLGGAIRHKLGSVSAAGVVTAWNPSLPSTAGTDVWSLRLDGDVIYAGGAFTTVAGAALTRNRLAAWDRMSGALIDWSPNVSGPIYSISGSGAEVTVAGAFTSSDLYVTGSWARYSGVPAVQTPTTVGSARLFTGSTVPNVYALVVDGNTAFLAGDFVAAGGAPHRRLAKVDLAAGAVTSWSGGTDAPVRSLAYDTAGGVLYSGGDFVIANGTISRNRLAAFDATTAALTSFAPSATNVVRALALDSSNGTLYVGGDFNGAGSLGGATRNRIGAIAIGTGSVTAFDPNANGAVRAIAVDAVSGVVYFGGDFTQLVGSTVARNRLAAAAVSTGVPTAFDPNVAGVVRAIALDATASTVFVGGDFVTVNGAATRNRLAALSTSTGVATAWNPNLNGAVYAIVTEPGGNRVYVGGAFTTVGGVVRNRLASIDLGSGSASTWNPNANNVVQGVALDVATKRVVAGGVFTTMGGAGRVAFARF